MRGFFIVLFVMGFNNISLAFSDEKDTLSEACRVSAIQQAVTNEPETDIYFYHSNQVNSTTHITDASGEVYQHLEYFPFGEKFVEERSSDTLNDELHYQFSGKENDEETGLYYYGARYYDPISSLWLGVDPKSDKWAAWSPYNYALNNPVKYTDADGRDIYVVTQNGTVLQGIDMAKQTVEGKELWRYYANSKDHDIYYCSQTLREQDYRGLTWYSFNVYNWESSPGNAIKYYDFYCFKNVDFSKSRNRHVSLIVFNDGIGLDATDFALTWFHETKGHVSLHYFGELSYENEGADIEHYRLGSAHSLIGRPGSPMEKFYGELERQYNFHFTKRLECRANDWLDALLLRPDTRAEKNTAWDPNDPRMQSRPAHWR